MFCIARFKRAWTSFFFVLFWASFLLENGQKGVIFLNYSTCIVLGWSTRFAPLLEVRVVILWPLLLFWYRSSCCTVEWYYNCTTFGVVEGSCLFLFLFVSFAFFTMVFPMRNLTRLVAVRYFLTCTLLKH